MKSLPVEWIGLAILVIGLSACNCIVGLLPESSDPHEAEKVTLLYWLAAKQSCELPGSINVGTSNGLFPECLLADDTGFIYNVATSSWVSTPSIVGVGDALQCRLTNRTDLASACGNRWYAYPDASPPPGALVTLVLSQTCTYDLSGNVTAASSLTGYTAGQAVFCAPALAGQPVQRLVIQ